MPLQRGLLAQKRIEEKRKAESFAISEKKAVALARTLRRILGINYELFLACYSSFLWCFDFVLNAIFQQIIKTRK